MEGHAARTVTPLTPRDRRVIVAIAVLLVVGVLVAVTFRLRSGGNGANADCVVENVASTTGGISARNCGAEARRFCASQGRIEPSVTAQCSRLGYPVR